MTNRHWLFQCTFNQNLLCPSTFNIGLNLDGERVCCCALVDIIVAVVVAIDNVECLLEKGEPVFALLCVSI